MRRTTRGGHPRLDAAGSPLTLTASIGNGYVPQTQIVNVSASQTTSTKLKLRPLAPCQYTDSASLASQPMPDQVVSQTLIITNSGAAGLTRNAAPSPASNSALAGSVVLGGGAEGSPAAQRAALI